MNILMAICVFATMLGGLLSFYQDTPEQSGARHSGTTSQSGRRQNLPDNVQEAWVRHYDSGLIPNYEYSGSDHATALAVDAWGNVYTTGSSKGPAEDFDFAAIKYNTEGDTQWVARYAGPSNSIDRATAILADRAGNVYVAGNSGGANLLVKYDGAGSRQWIASLNNQSNIWYLKQTSLVFDDEGNITLSGGTVVNVAAPFGLSLRTFYVTAKYDDAGKQQWAVLKTTSGIIGDFKTSMAVDKAGHFYVAGIRKDEGAATYNTVIKYDTSGEELWVAPFEGPNHAGAYPNAVAVDDSGNVYAAGRSLVPNVGLNFVTIKYNHAGIAQWMAQYTGWGEYKDLELGVNDLVLDHSGNIYVTGANKTSLFNADYVTIKYAPTGQELWVKRYNGFDTGDDFARAMTLDDAGNIYVTGRSKGQGTGFDFATVKYNANGETQWAARYNHPANGNEAPDDIVVDKAGNVYVSGISVFNDKSIYVTIKYVQTPVSVEEEEPNQPTTYGLAQNYPNPFGGAASSTARNEGSSATVIRYAIPKPVHVTLTVFNLQGQKMATLVNAQKDAGEYEIHWNPTNLSSGVYMYRLQAVDLAHGGGVEFVATRKLILMR